MDRFIGRRRKYAALIQKILRIHGRRSIAQQRDVLWDAYPGPQRKGHDFDMWEEECQKALRFNTPEVKQPLLF